MKLVFSEWRPDYGRYLFPYQVCGYLERGETAADALAAGMLPDGSERGEFYLARSIRVDLVRYRPNARVRAVARKCARINFEVVPAESFAVDDQWSAMHATYLLRRRGISDPSESLERIVHGHWTTHVLVYRDGAAERRVGLATMHVEPEAGHWPFSMYDTDYLPVGIGRYIITTVIETLQDWGHSFAYLGTCYEEAFLYKTRFPGMQFFNGRGWSDDRRELRFLLEHQARLTDHHLLEYPPYLERMAPATARLSDTDERGHALRFNSGAQCVD